MPDHDVTRNGILSTFTMIVLTGMVFVGALLLFGMEPLVGRLLTPYFGGAVHVWLTSMMFFQAMLLVGYLYAHLLAQKLGPWHLLLLALPLINLPLKVSTTPAPEMPVLTLLAVLLGHIALPFAVLSTTAVVAQVWLARSPRGWHQNPYPLYAASNAGSLLALLAYPFLVEPLLGLRAQSLAWTGGYALYAGLVVTAWFSLRPVRGPMAAVLREADAAVGEAPQARHYGLWLLLSGLPSAFLLSVTNFIALEVGSFPLVWVIPLSLYLGSFVITFRNHGGVPRIVDVWWPEVVLVGFILYLFPGFHGLQVAGQLLVLLILCLAGHGQLYECRPPVRYLTNYYLAMALGGLLGGVAVSLVAPLVFPGLFEYLIILTVLAITLAWARWRSVVDFWRRVNPVLGRSRSIALGVLVGVVGVLGISYFQGSKTVCQFRHRNFYGIYRVMYDPPTPESPQGLRRLVHGKTIHGAQLLAPAQRGTPASYYYPGGAIGEVYRLTPPPRRVAVLGLGAGAVAAYLHAHDTLTYYEIDGDVEKIARSWFTYLGDAQGRVEVVVGDGRLSLRIHDPDTKYDIIDVDAFTGDGIPTHLLTREALEVYLSRLAPGGVILLHISNRYYDLRAVVKATAAPLHLHGAVKVGHRDSQTGSYNSPPTCVLLARAPGLLEPFLSHGWTAFGPGDGLPTVAPWTDDYINILGPLTAQLRSR